MTSVSFFYVFIVNNWGKCLRGWGLARFSRPKGGGFELLFCLGVGNSPINTELPGGWSGLELTDTLSKWVAALFICLYMLEVSSVTWPDLGPIYTITNTQRIRIYPGELKSILVKISPRSRTLTWQTCQRKPNSIHISYWVQIRSISEFIQVKWNPSWSGFHLDPGLIHGKHAK